MDSTYRDWFNKSGFFTHCWGLLTWVVTRLLWGNPAIQSSSSNIKRFTLSSNHLNTFNFLFIVSFPSTCFSGAKHILYPSLKHKYIARKDSKWLPGAPKPNCLIEIPFLLFTSLDKLPEVFISICHVFKGIIRVDTWWDFLGGPVVKIPGFQCREREFEPWSGN